MKTAETVRLGYEVPGGAAVEIPIAHMVVTGQTQLSGKTTTLEALISRSGRKAIAFVTKRGEGAFASHPLGNKFVRDVGGPVGIKPFFRQRADWQFVSDILGAILSEKLKWERSNIIKVCKAAKSLEEVHANVKKKLAGKIRGIDEAICTQLDAYFDLLLPEIAKLPYTDKLELSDGLNVMDLSEYSTALQMLVIAAVLDEIYKKYKGVIVVIPEAWEFVPNGKNSPVKSAANTLARKGAALKNFIWLDSQDMASIDTEVRRACSVFILGVQREQNEVKRLLAHIPNMPKPKVEDVMHLEIGQFFACFGRELHKVYVQPAWMSADLAEMVANGDTVGVPSQDLQPPQGIAVLINGDKHTSISAQPRVEDVAVGDPIVFRDSRGEPPRYAEEVSHVKTKPSIRLSDTPVAEWERFVFDPEHARPTDVSVGDLIVDRNSFNESDYHRVPPGLDYTIDDGAGQHYHDRITEAVAKEIDVDTAERQRYERQIEQWQSRLYYVERRIPGTFAASHSLEEWKTEEGWKGSLIIDPRADESINFTREEASRGPCDDISTGTGLQPNEAQSLLKIIKGKLLVDPEFIERVATKMPTAGTVTLEPAEYVLKKFQQDEVARILVATDDMSVFQKRAIKFAEAKGKGTRTADLITTLTGKRSKNMARDCKDEYEELGELGTWNWLRYDRNNRVYHPNLGPMVKHRLAQFDPSNKDVDQVIGQVILKLK